MLSFSFFFTVRSANFNCRSQCVATAEMRLNAAAGASIQLNWNGGAQIQQIYIITHTHTCSHIHTQTYASIKLSILSNASHLHPLLWAISQLLFIFRRILQIFICFSFFIFDFLFFLFYFYFIFVAFSFMLLFWCANCLLCGHHCLCLPV